MLHASQSIDEARPRQTLLDEIGATFQRDKESGTKNICHDNWSIVLTDARATMTSVITASFTPVDDGGREILTTTAVVGLLPARHSSSSWRLQGRHPLVNHLPDCYSGIAVVAFRASAWPSTMSGTQGAAMGFMPSSHHCGRVAVQPAGRSRDAVPPEEAVFNTIGRATSAPRLAYHRLAGWPGLLEGWRGFGSVAITCAMLVIPPDQGAGDRRRLGFISTASA